jgi:hypothetical protein
MMTDIKQTTFTMTARRGFFTRVAGVMALGVAAFAPAEPRAETEAEDGPDWPGKLTGRHKQLVDAYAINEGFPLAFALNFLTPNESATAVIVLRHEAFPLALNHEMWAKYKIGEAEKIDDPETKAVAVNPILSRSLARCATTISQSTSCSRAALCSAPAAWRFGPMRGGSPRTRA